MASHLLLLGLSSGLTSRASHERPVLFRSLSSPGHSSSNSASDNSNIRAAQNTRRGPAVRLSASASDAARNVTQTRNLIYSGAARRNRPLALQPPATDRYRLLHGPIRFASSPRRPLPGPIGRTSLRRSRLHPHRNQVPTGRNNHDPMAHSTTLDLPAAQLGSDWGRRRRSSSKKFSRKITRA